MLPSSLFDEPILCTSYLCGGRTGLTTNANEPLARMMKNDSTLQLIRWCTMVTSLEVDNNSQNKCWQIDGRDRTERSQFFQFTFIAENSRAVFVRYSFVIIIYQKILNYSIIERYSTGINLMLLERTYIGTETTRQAGTAYGYGTNCLNAHTPSHTAPQTSLYMLSR